MLNILHLLHYNFSFIEEHKTATLAHFKRIADYIECGPGIWYNVRDSFIEFYDGFNEPDSRDEGPAKTHFR